MIPIILIIMLKFAINDHKTVLRIIVRIIMIESFY